uniref:NADH dehydrogenase subunit 2 n=1 Tax=Strongyloides vituli TaxID=553196 RepID=UPI0021B6CF68|nr:NADH dehydrogenase subunit 2 [Strongyloides vituli]UWI71775.1 NADH dehydrogenase subunit 2 [Strongyloides vituli]
MFIYLMGFYFFILFLVNLFTSNVVVWWVVFLLMTLGFIFINQGSRTSMINYFIVQEVLGFCFLLISFSSIQFVILLMKAGVAPFHFWVFSVTNNISGFGVMWFLTLQKLPFVPVVQYLLSSIFIYVLVFGILFCYFQLFFIKSYKNMMVLSSTESFNWLMLIMAFSLFSGLLFSVVYVVFFFFLLDFSSSKSFDHYNWETVLVFLNIPFSITFFIKFFSLVSVFNYSSFLILLVLFSMFLSMISLGFWLVNMSTKFYFDSFKTRSYWYWVCYPLMFVCLI